MKWDGKTIPLLIKRTSEESLKIKTKHYDVSGLITNHNAMYREFAKLSQTEQEIINGSLKNVKCSHALIDNIKRNILCLTNAGLIILWGVLQNIRHVGCNSAVPDLTPVAKGMSKKSGLASMPSKKLNSSKDVDGTEFLIVPYEIHTHMISGKVVSNKFQV